jgi:hypothetical protein
MNKFKSKLLTKLFVEWVASENDFETLELSKSLIQTRQDFLNGNTKKIGFRY